MGNVMLDRVETVRDETERGKRFRTSVRAGGEMAVDASHFSQFGL